MNEGRSYFNPCEFSGYVYVYGFPSQYMEAFSPQTNSFLPLQLPQLPESTGCCLFTHNSKLVVHTTNYISKFALGQTGQLVQHSRAMSRGDVSKWSNSQPVLDPVRGFFFMIQGNGCVSLKMQTGEEVQFFTLA